MDKKKELRRRLRAKIQHGKNLRTGNSTKEQMFRDNLAQNMANIIPADKSQGDTSLSDLLSNLKSLSDPKALKGSKAVKKARSELNNIVKTQLVNNIIESVAKTNPVNEISEDAVDKVLLDGLDVSDNESVSSNLD